jgi:hypothetical protein
MLVCESVSCGRSSSTLPEFSLCCLKLLGLQCSSYCWCRHRCPGCRFNDVTSASSASNEAIHVTKRLPRLLSADCGR